MEMILSHLERNHYQLQSIYTVDPLSYFNQLFMQPLYMLLGYLERIRRAMYGFSIKQIPITHSTLVYNHLLDGSMAIGDDYAPPLQPNQTYKGISLVDSENPSLLEKLGDDMILFTEWCQNWCSWRRRGYLVVVNELTRIIHNQFSNAQIELYGSSRTGLMIPSSDVDIVIVNNEELLDKVTAVLSDIPWIRTVNHIKGSVQVVKVVIDPTVMANTTMIPTLERDELVCDITQISTTHTGITTAVAIKNKLNRFWELTPLILFLKELLYENQLNSAYEGGMNSVAAVIVVIAFFHDWIKMQEGSYDTLNSSFTAKKRELGTLIVQLLYYLGFEFNYVMTGASADTGFFSRDERIRSGSFFFESDLIVVIDPVNAANNLGKSCFNIYQIKCLLRQTYQRLMKNIDEGKEHPLLSLLNITEQCITFKNHYS